MQQEDNDRIVTTNTRPYEDSPNVHVEASKKNITVADHSQQKIQTPGTHKSDKHTVIHDKSPCASAEEKHFKSRLLNYSQDIMKV